jgi:hypothetical protein
LNFEFINLKNLTIKKRKQIQEQKIIKNNEISKKSKLIKKVKIFFTGKNPLYRNNNNITLIMVNNIKSIEIIKTIGLNQQRQNITNIIKIKKIHILNQFKNKKIKKERIKK